MTPIKEGLTNNERTDAGITTTYTVSRNCFENINASISTGMKAVRKSKDGYAKSVTIAYPDSVYDTKATVTYDGITREWKASAKLTGCGPIEITGTKQEVRNALAAVTILHGENARRLRADRFNRLVLAKRSQSGKPIDDLRPSLVLQIKKTNIFEHRPRSYVEPDNYSNYQYVADFTANGDHLSQNVIIIVDAAKQK